MSTGKGLQNPEHCRFRDGRARPEPREDPRVRLQCSACLSVARIMTGSQRCPLRAHEPGPILLLAHSNHAPPTLRRLGGVARNLSNTRLAGRPVLNSAPRRLGHSLSVCRYGKFGGTGPERTQSRMFGSAGPRDHCGCLTAGTRPGHDISKGRHKNSMGIPAWNHENRSIGIC